jgi:hypothetical protein
VKCSLKLIFEGGETVPYFVPSLGKLHFNNPTPTIGPTLLTMDRGGIQRNACLFASPHSNARHALAVTCERIPTLCPEPEMFLFYFGFDPAEMMTDPTKGAGFLAFLYPLSAAEKTKERLGSVDWFPG